jgi:hypothetical protein
MNFMWIPKQFEISIGKTCILIAMPLNRESYYNHHPFPNKIEHLLL